MNSPTTWLLWDGDCDFCESWAGWLEQNDTNVVLTIIPYQDAPSPPMTPALRIQASRAVQLVTSDGTHLSGAAAVLFALESVGWHAGVMRALQRRPLLWLADAGYWVVARSRGRIGRFGCCRS